MKSTTSNDGKQEERRTHHRTKHNEQRAFFEFLRKIHHTLDAVAGVSAACMDAARTNIDQWLYTVQHGELRRPQWLALVRKFNATPAHVSFHEMRSVLAPIARYYWKSKSDVPWKLVAFDEFVASMPKHRTLRHCVCELFAQTVEVLWAGQGDGDSGETEFFREDVHQMPQIIANTKASCVHIALESLLPQFSIDYLMSLSEYIPWLLRYVSAGNAP